MSKIMLVEDDNNLREIYEARLLAEGYEIVAAHDGEEALALAVKEKPDLIISDVMMPKISGFDMLDILRSTPETKDTKVIMMTALSQAEDKSRADKLGADRYLVKSQVTLEDVAKIAREVLEGTSGAPAAPATDPAATPDPVATSMPTPQPAAPAAAPAMVTPDPVSPQPVVAEPVATPPAADPVVPAPPVAGAAQTTSTAQSAVNSQINDIVSPSSTATPVATPPAGTTPSSTPITVSEPVKPAVPAGEDPNLIAL
jgi:CheY-like chemotaxis protein